LYLFNILKYFYLTTLPPSGAIADQKAISVKSTYAFGLLKAKKRKSYTLEGLWALSV
jgi:hypothetical protein